MKLITLIWTKEPRSQPQAKSACLRVSLHVFINSYFVASTKRIKGIPGNLANSYLSTYGHYYGGYMADWINYLTRLNNVERIEIDILNKTILPAHLETPALLIDLTKLQGILEHELNNIGFEMSFIQKAVMKFEVPIHDLRARAVYCTPFLVDVNGKIYKPKRRVVDIAYDDDFPGNVTSPEVLNRDGD